MTSEINSNHLEQNGRLNAKMHVQIIASISKCFDFIICGCVFSGFRMIYLTDAMQIPEMQTTFVLEMLEIQFGSNKFLFRTL